MTLDAIIDRYQAGTLAAEPDAVLHDAQTKVALWHDWRQQHPEAKPDAVPSVSLLRSIFDFIEKTINRRYGCND